LPDREFYLYRCLSSAHLSGRDSSEAAPVVHRLEEAPVCRVGDAACAGAHEQRLARAPVSAESVLQLQRQYGNRFARQVLGRAVSGEQDDHAGGSIKRSIEDARGSGKPLDRGVNAQMQSAFGADFGGVRVHNDTRADSLSRSLGAVAFTTGSDVFFRTGAYNPGSSSGRELIAHELTHVVQQNGADVKRQISVSEPGDPSEREAEQTAARVMESERSEVSRAAATEEEEKQPLARAVEEDKDKEAVAIGRQPESGDKDKEDEQKLAAPVARMEAASGPTYFI
jgi:hypothetical protein